MYRPIKEPIEALFVLDKRVVRFPNGEFATWLAPEVKKYAVYPTIDDLLDGNSGNKYNTNFSGANGSYLKPLLEFEDIDNPFHLKNQIEQMKLFLKSDMIDNAKTASGEHVYKVNGFIFTWNTFICEYMLFFATEPPPAFSPEDDGLWRFHVNPFMKKIVDKKIKSIHLPKEYNN